MSGWRSGLTAFSDAAYRSRSDRCCLQRFGYDLTGNVSGLCPECGTEVERMP